jgi:UDP-sulfoquinovose synthase
MPALDNSRETILVLGGDGYLGWSVALALANRTDKNVVIVDNMIKRHWEQVEGVSALFPVGTLGERVAAYASAFGRENLHFAIRDVTKFDEMSSLLNQFMPRVVINAAQQPSAPFSMKNARNGQTTFQNNVASALNCLWSIAEVDPSIRYLSMGSAGSFLSIDTEFVPNEKIDLSFKWNGNVHRIAQSWLPMQASDFYHQSKIITFLISDLCSSIWNIPVLTVQQATIFGNSIAENAGEQALPLGTRLHYDSIFGTVLNRFICQAAVGYPLTVYGDGSQETGLISLRDTVDRLVCLADEPLEGGRHRVENNLTYKLSVRAMADRVSRVTGAQIHTIANPRKESAGQFSKRFASLRGSLPTASDLERLDQEIGDIFRLACRHRHRIHQESLQPDILWSGATRQPVCG